MFLLQCLPPCSPLHCGTFRSLQWGGGGGVSNLRLPSQTQSTCAAVLLRPSSPPERRLLGKLAFSLFFFFFLRWLVAS